MAKRRPLDAAAIDRLRASSVTVSHTAQALSFDDFERFIRYSRRLLGDVAFAATGTYGDWVLTDLRFGSAIVSAAPIGLDGRAPYVEDLVVSGLRQVEEGSAKPPFFSEAALRYSRILSILANDAAIVVSAPSGERAAITRRAGANVAHLLQPRKHYFGSVVGSLDVVSVHKGHKVTIYSESGDVARCYLAPGMLEDALELLGERVVVTGELASNSFGQVVSVRAETFFRAPTRIAKDVSAFWASVPDLTGGLPVSEYLDGMWAVGP